MIDIDKAFEGRWRLKNNRIKELETWYVGSSPIDLMEKVKELCRDFFEAGLALVQSETTGLPKKVIQAGQPNSIEMRSARFFNTFYTNDNVNKYSKQMLQDFYEYWSEPNPSHTKMRFELQKTWDVNRRLARWARNNFNRYDRQQSTTEDKFRKLGEVLAP